MTCLTAHIFPDPEVRERGTVHLTLTKQTDQPSKALHLKCNLHHAYGVHWGMTFQVLIFCLPNRTCVCKARCGAAVLVPWHHDCTPALTGTVTYLLS